MSTQYMPRLTTPLVLSLALLAGACKGRDAGRDTTALGADTALNRDLNLAGRDTAAQPQLRDVPANTGAATTPANTSTRTTTTPRTTTSGTRSSGTTTRSNTSTPTTTRSGNTVTRGGGAATGTTSGGGAVASLPAGTSLTFTSNKEICTNTANVGDTFTATLSSAVSAGGVTVPAGTTANVEVQELKRSNNVNDKAKVRFRVVSLNIGGRTYPVTATTSSANIERVRNQPKSKDVQKVATGAAIGAIAGQVLGKSTKSTVIGAAAGAAAGTAAAAATANYEGCLRSGAAFTVRLDAPAQIRAE